MSKYWLTTQEVDQRNGNGAHAGVYPTIGRAQAIDTMAADDIVFIYESKNAGGTPKGREGIVSIVKVRAPLPTKGTKVDTTDICSDGYVDRGTVNAIMGFNPDYNLHGFGEYHSGTKEIDSQQAQSLKNAFCKNCAKYQMCTVTI